MSTLVLCSSCWDNSGAVNVLGFMPQSNCARCGRLCLGYGADEEEIAAAERTAKEWISVRDQVPEQGPCVIAAWDDGQVRPSCYYPDNKWLALGSVPRDAEVTHWQPLPTHPRANE